MIDESLFKTSFIGRDGFRWWIGQVPPITVQGEQSNGGGWGNRLKVRILGYHPANPAELSDNDLPWAQVMLPTTTGSGAGSYAVNPKIRPGDTVLGFFLDGDGGQIPVIMGCFGRTGEVPSTEYLAPFMPFTGYTSRVKKPNGTLTPSEASEDSTQAQKSPRKVPTETVDKLNAKSEEKTEVSYHTSIGKKVVLGNSSDDNTAKGIEAETYNLIKKVNDPYNKILNKVAEVSKSTDKIMGITEGIVGQCTDALYNGLIPILNQGLKALYSAVYAAVLAATGNPVAAHLAGVLAQQAMVIPVKELQKMIPRIPGMVINTMFGTVQGLLTDVVDNVKRPSKCMSIQVTASVINEILRKIEGGLSGVLGGVNKILSAGFNVIDFLTSGVAAIKGISGLFDLNQNKNKSFDNTDVWRIGIGPDVVADKLLDFKEILDNMNRANAARKNLVDEVKSGAEGVKAGFDIFSEATQVTSSGCYTGPIVSCTSPPKVKFFGGMGSGASGEVVLGNFEKDPAGTILSGAIIGVDLLSGGSNYKYPPFVEIVDECEQGYGAVARSVINEVGEVTGIYVVSPGENYPVGNPNVTSGETIADQNPANTPVHVDRVIVVEGGTGYDPNTDDAIDDIGNIYNLEIDIDGPDVSPDPGTDPGTDPGPGPGTSTVTGSIITCTITSPSPEKPGDPPSTPINIPKVIGNNYIPTENLPNITIRTRTGSGAILRPVMKNIPFNRELLATPDGRIDPRKLRELVRVKSVVDCINEPEKLIGYVNGQPYYGEFHIHPTTGVKMVGEYHVDTAHDIIYDTREESLGRSRSGTQDLVINQQVSSSTLPAPVVPVSQTTATPAPSPTPAPAPTPTPAPAPTPTPAPAPAPTPTPAPSPSPTPPPSSGGGGYGGY